MSMIDLTRLPAPQALEPLGFEALLTELTLDFARRWPAFAAFLESEPVIKLLELAAWRELLLRARINDAYKNGTLAYAVGADLDHIGALHGCARKPDEGDHAYRLRIQQAYWRLAAAGPAAAFEAHAMEAHPAVVDAQAWSDGAGRASVAVLAYNARDRAALSLDAQAEADALTRYAFAGAPILDTGKVCIQSAMLDAPMRSVRERLLSEDVLPLGLELAVRPAQLKTYRIEAALILQPGPDADVILTEARTELDAALRRLARLGFDAPRAALIDALFVPGVTNVLLAAPENDVVCTEGWLAVPLSINLSVSEVRDV